MDGVLLLAGIAGVLAGLGITEKKRLVRNRRRVPIRIHVNGTRGKSSVTRLIAAGLRAGGLKTCAKTTGTLPRFIAPDGSEEPVARRGRANVIEQVDVMRKAADCGAEAIVLECMAVNPLLQSLCELEIVRATHGVITNARPDHLDVMGPTPADVARALAGTAPVGGTLFTAERALLAPLAEAARDRGSKLVAVGRDDVAAVGPDDLSGFEHIEHPDNVALALRVCESLGVDRDTALIGMWAAQPDPGVMSRHEFWEGETRLTFVNGFAANDPESTECNWRQVSNLACPGQARVIVVNCRADRADRSRQMAEMCARWSDVDAVFAVGTGTDVFRRRCIALGAAATVTAVERISAETLLRRIALHTPDAALVMGIGNIAGIGMDLANLSRQRSKLPRVPERPLQLQEAA